MGSNRAGYSENDFGTDGRMAGRDFWHAPALSIHFRPLHHLLGICRFFLEPRCFDFLPDPQECRRGPPATAFDVADVTCFPAAAAGPFDGSLSSQPYGRSADR